MERKEETKEKKVIKIGLGSFIFSIVLIVIALIICFNLYAKSLGQPNLISSVERMISGKKDEENKIDDKKDTENKVDDAKESKKENVVADNKEEVKPEGKIEGIVILTPPNKTEYFIGEKFDKTGMRVALKYSNGATKEITNYHVYEGELELGRQTVMISYEDGDRELEVAQRINVKRNNNADIYQAYKNKMNELFANIEKVYAYVDIDKNGTEELIVITGSFEAEKEGRFFTYKNGKVIDLGTIPMGNSVLYEMYQVNYIRKIYGHMGYETVYDLRIENDKIVPETVSEREISANEDYQEGDIQIIFN